MKLILEGDDGRTHVVAERLQAFNFDRALDSTVLVGLVRKAIKSAEPRCSVCGDTAPASSLDASGRCTPCAP
jgi:hypothetical protein